MSGNDQRKRTRLQQLSDRLIFSLTGKKPRHKHPHIPSEKVLFSEDFNKPVVIIPKREPVVKKKKPGLLKRLVNPKNKYRSNSHHGGIHLNPPAIPPEREGAGFTDSDISQIAVEDRPRPPMPAKATPKPQRKRKSLHRILFGTRKKKQEPVRLVIENKSDDKHVIRKALRTESYALLNSLGFYILAYLTVYLIYQFSTALVASNFNIDSVLFYYEIYFPIGNASPLWNRFNIIAITFAGPFIAILTTLILLRAVLLREKLGPQFRLYLLWVAFHSATHFLGAFVAGIATSQGFGYVADWLFINVFFRILISLVFLFMLTITGYNSAVFALETIPSGIRQQRWRLSLSLGLRFILPWIIGGLMVIAIKFPDSAPQHPNIMVYDAVIIATMGFMVIPVFFNRKARPRSLAERPPEFKRPPGILVFVSAIVALVVFRLIFERGLHLVINFSFDVGFYR